MNRFLNCGRSLLACVCLLLSGMTVEAADWPMWRYDSTRSAAAPESLPDGLKQIWSRKFSPRKQTWDDPLNLDLMTFDRFFEPIVMGGRLFLAFNDRDKVVAYDLKTGAESWTFYADGPIRLAPVAWNNRVYFASDDGHMYCVNAEDGSLHWRFRGGPNGRQILGNQRLISMWPMRGGPVLRDGHLYFAASIWPFMGTFIYSLDAETGEVEWVNDESGAQYILQPHGAPSFAGVAPQGSLVATQDVLLIPGGRSVPAAFNRHTGKFLYFELAAGGKGTGGSFVAANEESWFVHTRLKGTREFSLQTGVKTAFLPDEPVLAGDRIYAVLEKDTAPLIRAFDSRSKESLWQIAADGRGDLILAGDRLYAAGKPSEHPGAEVRTELTAIQLPQTGTEAMIAWTTSVPGSVVRLVAANETLIAVTLEGHLYAFGNTSTPTDAVQEETFATLEVSDEAAGTAKSVLNAGRAEGYSLWLGAADESLVTAVANESPFVELSVIDPEQDRVDRLRRHFDTAGILGRVTVRRSTPAEFLSPPYLANLLFVGAELTPALCSTPELLARFYDSVRPYGGVMYLLAPAADREQLIQQVAALELESAEIERAEHGIVVRRVGALPGSGTWTHQNGDIGNTNKSSDQRVKLPLGVLWFGGSNHEDVLPRHGHGPTEQVVGGRLFIEGINSLSARDVYTGRKLWHRNFENLGTKDVYFDETYKETPLDPSYNQIHIPGANARGTNFVVTPDRIYIVEGFTCHVLDPATGEDLTTITLPQQDPNQPHEWGFIGVYEDVLIGGVGFAQYQKRHELEPDKADPKRAVFGAKSLDRAASMALVGFDRHSGEQLWKIDAAHSFWHNGIVAGNGLVFALDKNPKPVEEFLRRRGKSNPDTYRIVAFDAKTGQEAWTLPGKEVFGTWLGYSEKRDLLLQAGAAGSDRLTAEVGQGMAVYQGRTGETVWKKEGLKYSGPCVLHNDLIITNAVSYTDSAGAYYLADGSQKMNKSPLTGELRPWSVKRAYGCNSIIASENMLTFRSGSAAFYDLLNEAGTGNFGGFRSGCTANLIVADGVLNAPDYTRTCSCSYQNQTSLALVHMPDIDMWSVNNLLVLDPKAGRVQQLGINLGAPGDRRDQHGLDWLEYPPVAGDSPNLSLEVDGESRFFQDHPSTKSSATIPWVASSGVEGMQSLRLSLKAQPLHKLQTGIPVEHADDDARESITSGAVDLDSGTAELAGTTAEPQLVGFRFNGIRLARDSAIRSAHLQFGSRAVGEEPAEFVIRAEAAVNAARFTADKNNLSSRRLTSSEIRWSPDAWKLSSTGSAQQSSDLTPLIREVISQEGWQPGNSIVFVIRGQGQRTVATVRSRDATGAARLVVDADEVTPVDDSAARLDPYRVRLHFGVPESAPKEFRQFDVEIPGQGRIDNIQLGGTAPKSIVKTFDRVLLGDWLELMFISQHGRPLVSGIELHRLEQ
ncbi:PQQ-binding-like beta-propeller repeat protein [Schlesneria sp. DSM 10557]|uniref:outer membrane protein assembly factor BamB family protein n=1 Tax=Schlesneria sp. DSM 10557 TaxID=3044399 RepID=UPI0035A05D46